MIELLLAVLSASAAAGMRIALPLLIIGLLYGESLWARVPILCNVSPPIVLAILVSWSLLEIFASKHRFGLRSLQIVQLLLSPLVGAIMGLAIAQATDVPGWVVGLLGAVGGLLALVLQLVQVGWFYRLSGLPLWVIFLQDTLCISLVMLAFDAPKQGGIIALLLLWLAIRTSKNWQRWYRQQAHPQQKIRGAICRTLIEVRIKCSPKTSSDLSTAMSFRVGLGATLPCSAPYPSPFGNAARSLC